MIETYQLQNADFSFFPLNQPKNYFELMLGPREYKSIIAYNYLPVIVPNRIRICGEKGYTMFAGRPLKFIAINNIACWDDYSQEYFNTSCKLVLDEKANTPGKPMIWVFGPRYLMVSMAHHFSIQSLKAYYHARDVKDRPFVISKTPDTTQHRLITYPLQAIPVYANAS